MSELLVKVQKINEIKEHPNADRLEVAVVGAWETCVKKDTFCVGDLVVFISPDSILPNTLHEFLGITNYCASMPKNTDENKQGKKRVKATRLRGVRSFGTLMTIEDLQKYVRLITDECGALAACEGDDVASLLGITKYVPSEKTIDGDADSPNELFHRYTDIECYQNYPDWFVEGEEVAILEKIHGTNCRIGMVRVCDGVTEFMCGSNRVRRREYTQNGSISRYWKPLKNSFNLQDMIMDIQYDKNALSVIVFGEIYGSGIQDMVYDGGMNFAVFDIAINGEYLPWTEVEYLCGIYGVNTVPVLYKGPFSHEKLMKHTDGPTTVCKPEEVRSSFKGREGCVVRPLREERLTKTGRRVILKSVSVDYLDRKNPSDNA